jgi:protein phosphatase
MPVILNKYEFGSALDIGRKRRHRENQDAIGWLLPKLLNPKPPLFIVADGMGGHSGGQIASNLVVDTMKNKYQRASKTDDLLPVLERCVLSAHQAVVKRGQKNPDLASMGSTVVASIIQKDTIHLVNIGDSRAYLVSEEQIQMISYDHSWVAEQVRQGQMSPQEAQKHPNRNRLIMSINARRPQVTPYLTKIPFFPGQNLILCSDGLWGMVPASLIFSVVTELTPQSAADKLVNLANANHGRDNISVIIVRYLKK